MLYSEETFKVTFAGGPKVDWRSGEFVTCRQELSGDSPCVSLCSPASARAPHLRAVRSQQVAGARLQSEPWYLAELHIYDSNATAVRLRVDGKITHSDSFDCFVFTSHCGLRRTCSYLPLPLAPLANYQLALEFTRAAPGSGQMRGTALCVYWLPDKAKLREIHEWWTAKRTRGSCKLFQGV